MMTGRETSRRSSRGEGEEGNAEAMASLTRPDASARRRDSHSRLHASPSEVVDTERRVVGDVWCGVKSSPQAALSFCRLSQLEDVVSSCSSRARKSIFLMRLLQLNGRYFRFTLSS